VRIVDPKDALIVVDNDGDELWFYDAAGAVAVATAPRDQKARGFAVVLDEGQAREAMAKLQAMIDRVFGPKGE